MFFIMAWLSILAFTMLCMSPLSSVIFRTFNGHVRTRAHRNTNVGLREGG